MAGADATARCGGLTIGNTLRLPPVINVELLLNGQRVRPAAKTPGG